MITSDYKKVFAKNLSRLLAEHNKTQSDLVNDLKLNKSTVSTWINATKMPRMNKVEQLANYFGIEKSDLIEEKIYQSNDDINQLTAKDEREINERIESILSDMDSTTGLAAYGGTIDSEDDIELIKNSLEQALKLAKRAAKSKFTPNKYKQ